MSRPSYKKSQSPFKHNRTRLNVEALENRVTPTTITNTISGFVYYDANNNGLFDPGETPIANNTVQLQNASGTIIGTTTTDATGFYNFTNDQSNLTQDGSVTKTVTFPSTQTNFNLNGVLAQFDPSLGQLQSVEIQHAGSITSEIKAENLSSDSTSHLTGNVSGTLNLVAPGVNDNLTINGAAGSFDAAKYDGTTDFGGTSGTSFGQKTANGSNTINVTDAASLAAYTGTGTVNITETANATSNATGGGNVEVNVASTGQSTITVTYHYKTAGPLLPGTYKVVQPVEPTGFTDGLESQGGTVIPNTIGTDFINVSIPAGGGTSTQNDFGELKATSISGHVYYDANNNGKFDATETGIAGVTMTLTGGPGAPVTTTTDANGAYSFNNLTPGTYAVAETQPANYLNGTDTAGTKGGTVNNVPNAETIASVTLASGDSGQNYDFGELKPASLAGNVYVDAKNDGQLDPGDPPIAGNTVTLTGFNDQGPVSTATTTAADGSYSFTNLRPGTYAITQSAPAGYTDAATTVGSQGGTSAPDVVSDIQLNAGVAGINNNFGELQPSIPTPPTPPNPLPKDANLLGMLPIFNKNQLLVHPNLSNVDPAVQAQMAFVVGANTTLTGQQLDLVGTINAVNQLSNGTSPQAYVNQLWASDAHRAQQADNLYESILKRAPTAAEQAAVIQQLDTGTNVLTVMQNLYSSTDFQQNLSSQALAAALSEDILNTTPGTAASAALLQSMANDPLSKVVGDLLNSDASLANLIDTTYLQTVRRHASTAEIQTWTAPIKAGATTLDDLAQRLLGSQEFYQLAYNNIH
jgi:uncharacterized protein (DUF2141 family)